MKNVYFHSKEINKFPEYAPFPAENYTGGREYGARGTEIFRSKEITA